MATKSEDVKVLEKVVSIAKRELDPVEYVRFLTLITPKTGDSTKELREIRDVESYEEIIEEADSVFVFPMCDDCFKKIKLIGEGFDKDLVSDKMVTKIF